MLMNADIELEDLVFDANRGGYWLKPQAARAPKKGRCQSPAEVLFWNAASLLLPGLVRQFHVAGTRYHFDFALPEKMIGVEIDGYQWHSTRQQRQHDSQRDRILQGLGWKVLRFTASEVTRKASACAEEVLILINNLPNG